jgi:hypothetical protein
MAQNLFETHFKFQTRFLRNLKGHDAPILHSIFDDDTIITASEDSTINVFDKAVTRSYESETNHFRLGC